ncbi:TIGR00730 family Rossman fold protein [Brevibacillus fluminis]|uniref:Cytokinin riboside 5'-monophosphate phosphoribohydrolase n=1 Tax=Brevibacillus fluminis TaxID=511487 RepID=A0A3M8DW45_9BACL|nr:TIGR00730 family Rossman fold protein [Brevibacillus fluminis]RNB92328.1 TIGR00730 family Rossman fold protein [Brevibacillus fluminis]
MKRVCVYAGSNLGAHPDYVHHAKELGRALVNNGLELVYGGSRVGLMGELANQVLELGGSVTGVMPTGLFRGEVVHTGLTQLIEVKDMHERKSTMSRLADAYIALPGGFGTFEELFEMICWAQIGIHQKPIGIFNIAGYYTPLLQMIDHSIAAGFVKEEHKQLVLSASDSESLIQLLQSYVTPVFGNKWNQLS